MDHLIKHETAVVISDLHIADPELDQEGNRRGLDDFDQDSEFSRLLLEVIPTRAGWPTTLIINGDFIDFIQILPELGRHNAGDKFGVTEEHSVLKINQAFKGHPVVFDSLAQFIEKGGQILVLPGNHDIDFHWPRVFEAFRQRLGNVPEPQLMFVRNATIDEQRVYIEHGNQYSFDNKFDHWLDPIREAPDGRRRIERPWGTLFVDTIYNEIKDLYPFSNKVYPHAELAWIALRSYKDDKNVSVNAIAKLMLFFTRKGKRFLWGRLLGDDDRAVSMNMLWERLGAVDEERRAAINAEITAITGESDHNTGKVRPRGPTSTMLGQTDERGMMERRRQLLQSGLYDLVIFGHTHDTFDGNDNPSFGPADRRRTFNTGSWVPKIPIGEFEKPQWKDLANKSTVPHIYYLVINLKPHPTASLERLLPPDKLKDTRQDAMTSD